MARWESRRCKSTLPLCHSNPDPFLNECYPGCSGYARPPVSIPSTPLLTLPPAYFSMDSPRIETKICDIFAFSPLFSSSKKEKKKKKTMQQRCIEYRMLELLFVLPILSFFQRFDKNFITRSETKRWKNEICQFFLPLFFPPFSINFNSSFQKHLPYVIASNVWNYRMFADARANWNTELRKWIKKSVFPPDISYLTRFKFSIKIHRYSI